MKKVFKRSLVFLLGDFPYPRIRLSTVLSLTLLLYYITFYVFLQVFCQLFSLFFKIFLQQKKLVS